MGGDENLKAELAKAIAECEYLREENARLKLQVGETPDRRPSPEQPPLLVNEKLHSSATVTADSQPEVKVSLFKDLFRGRDDVYAIRWEGKIRFRAELRTDIEPRRRGRILLHLRADYLYRLSGNLASSASRSGHPYSELTPPSLLHDSRDHWTRLHRHPH